MRSLAILTATDFSVGVDLADLARFERVGGRRRAVARSGAVVVFDEVRLIQLGDDQQLDVPALIAGLFDSIGLVGLFYFEQRLWMRVQLGAPDAPWTEPG